MKKRRLIYKIMTLTWVSAFLFLSSGTWKAAAESAEGWSFEEYYHLSPLDLHLQAPQYTLPLQVGEISNFPGFSETIVLGNDALELLQDNGFVVIDNPFNEEEEDITAPYKALKDSGIPILVTSDSLLHLYHIQFDETLRQIEERQFYDMIWRISKGLLNDSLEQYKYATGDLKEASRRNAAYFAVGLSLLSPEADQICRGEMACKDPGLASAYFRIRDLRKYQFEVPEFISAVVDKELELIERHEGFSESPLFVYKEDYSQYVPRGHYTRSERLINYFKAFMWYGRISMLLKGADAIPPGEADSSNPDALISTYDAKIQTIQACLIASDVIDNKDIKCEWDRIYSITAFYAGLSDDLGPYEYTEALDSVFGGEFDPNDLDEGYLVQLKAELAEYMPPQIFGGTGGCAITPPFTSEQADQCLEKTKGFRLMGQRFIPDSYMFSNLVGAYTDIYTGNRNCGRVFTCVNSGEGTDIRGFPRGLDVMALLGSDRARDLLTALDDSNYRRYGEAYQMLDNEFSGFDESDWNKNLYWSWLFALRALLEECGPGYPTFMQTEAWRDKELTTALASWAELRHDTILYAKQSYTMEVTSLPSPERPVVGYVEPLPEFYNRLLALTRMTTEGLIKMQVLDNSARQRLKSLERILERLLVLSEKELKNEELVDEDYEFIRDFGDELNGVIADVDDRAKKTVMIADVHTDGNTGQVLEEGVGHVKLIIAAYRVPDGRVLIGAGPGMSYYEFKHPMQDRLTDERWGDMLLSNPPERPEWISSFAE
ncbi:MAG: DUF3160 domain-containing protein [Thermodesulfobacteriota bacterium]|nr:DUF3160 domain-containing protein [Thermodesulfobacteriota bacterium]